MGWHPLQVFPSADVDVVAVVCLDKATITRLFLRFLQSDGCILSIRQPPTWLCLNEQPCADTSSPFWASFGLSASQRYQQLWAKLTETLRPSVKRPPLASHSFAIIQDIARYTFIRRV